MNSIEKDPFKSRYRGVYRCGRRWKAQLQSHGIQFYLGMFDSEEEAARAYDKKAREEKGGKTLTNFENGEEDYGGFNMGPNGSPYRYGDGDDDENENAGDGQGNNAGNANTRVRPAPNDAEFGMNKRVKSEDHEYGGNAKRLDYQSTTENMRILWDRHCQIAQRLLLAKAAQAKLQEFQASAPDSEKASILKSLNEEIVLLVVVKAQLEEAVSRCYLLGLDLNTSTGMAPVVVPSVALPQGSTSFAATAVPSELAPYSMPQHIDVMKLPIHQQDRKHAAMASMSLSSAGASTSTADGKAMAYPMHMSSSGATGPAGMMNYSAYSSAMMSAPTTNPYLMPYQYNTGLTTQTARPSNSTRQYMGMGNYTINGKRPFPSPLSLSMSAPSAYGAPATGSASLGATLPVPVGMGQGQGLDTAVAGTMGYGMNQNLNASLGAVPLSVPVQMARPGMTASSSQQQQQYMYVPGSVSASTFFPAPPPASSSTAATALAPPPAPTLAPASVSAAKAPLNGGNPALNGHQESAKPASQSTAVGSVPAAPVPVAAGAKTAGAGAGAVPPPVSPNAGSSNAVKTASALVIGKPAAPFESNAFFVGAPAAVPTHGRVASKQGTQGVPLPLPLPLSLSVFPVAPNFSTTKVPPAGNNAVTAAHVSHTGSTAVPSTAPSSEVAVKTAGSAPASLTAPATAPPKSTGPAPKQFAHKVVQGQSSHASGQAATANGKKGKAEQVSPPVVTATPTEAQEKVSAPGKVSDKPVKGNKVESKSESSNGNSNDKSTANNSTRTAAAAAKEAPAVKSVPASASTSSKEKDKVKVVPEPAKPASTAPPTRTTAAAAIATSTSASTSATPAAAEPKVAGRAANPPRSAKGSAGEVKPVPVPEPAKPVPVYQIPTPVLSKPVTRKR